MRWFFALILLIAELLVCARANRIKPEQHFTSQRRRNWLVSQDVVEDKAGGSKLSGKNVNRTQQDHPVEEGQEAGIDANEHPATLNKQNVSLKEAKAGKPDPDTETDKDLPDTKKQKTKDGSNNDDNKSNTDKTKNENKKNKGNNVMMDDEGAESDGVYRGDEEEEQGKDKTKQTKQDNTKDGAGGDSKDVLTGKNSTNKRDSRLNANKLNPDSPDGDLNAPDSPPQELPEKEGQTPVPAAQKNEGETEDIKAEDQQQTGKDATAATQAPPSAQNVVAANSNLTHSNSSIEILDVRRARSVGGVWFSWSLLSALLVTYYAGRLFHDWYHNVEFRLVIGAGARIRKRLNRKSTDNSNGAVAGQELVMKRKKKKIVDIEMDTIKTHLDFEPNLLGCKDTPLLAHSMIEQLWSMVPLSLTMRDLQLVYSASQHGARLATFYENNLTGVTRSPGFMLLRDSKGYVFGVFSQHGWQTSNNSYYGNGETFVFTLRPNVAKYPWSRRNNFFLLSKDKFFAVGGGDQGPAIWVDDHFKEGSSYPCLTFGSPRLSHSAHFYLHEVEVWRFV